MRVAVNRQRPSQAALVRRVLGPLARGRLGDPALMALREYAWLIRRSARSESQEGPVRGGLGRVEGAWMQRGRGAGGRRDRD